MAAQHTAKAEAEPVIEPDRRAVEHLPEPDERLADSVLLGVDVAVVLGLEGRVSRVKLSIRVYMESSLLRVALPRGPWG